MKILLKPLKMLGRTLLIDSNILVSALLKQNDYKAAKLFLKRTEELGIKLIITDFSAYSISILLNARNEIRAFKKFLDILENYEGIEIYRLQAADLKNIFHLKLKLDFDDKLQYYIAQKIKIPLITCDRDFRKTDLRRFTPAQALKSLESS